MPPWVASTDDAPRVVAAGHWLAPVDGFFPGWGRQVPHETLPDAAVQEVQRSGRWCKLIVDWASGEGSDRRYGPTVTPDVVAEVARRVHAAGGRLAVHTMHPDGAEAAVMAGADSLEHGVLLRPDLLDQMAAQGTVLVPTMVAFAQNEDCLRNPDPPTPLSRFILRGWEQHPHLVRTAHEAGVTVLAGTDSTPHGNVAAEVRSIADAGVPPRHAVAGASWAARQFLGLAGLEEGAPADIVAYDSDPRADVGALARPSCVVIKGRLRHRRP